MIGDVNLFLNDADEPTVAEIEVIRSQMHCKHMQLVFGKEKKNYIFWCQFYEKPSVILDCPGSWSLSIQKASLLLHWFNSAVRNQIKSGLWLSIQIMIAVKASRRKGLAFEALTTFMAYAVKYLVGVSLSHCAFFVRCTALSMVIW